MRSYVYYVFVNELVSKPFALYSSELISTDYIGRGTPLLRGTANLSPFYETETKRCSSRPLHRLGI